MPAPALSDGVLSARALSCALGGLALLGATHCAPQPTQPDAATAAGAQRTPAEGLPAVPAAAAAAGAPPSGAAPVATAPAQAASPSPANPCAPAWFCDDFEDDPVGAAPAAPWRDETGPSGATVRVDTVHAHSGHNAVHVHAPRGASYRRGYFAVHSAPVFPAASREMYGRAMVWLDQAPITPPGKPPVHWTLFQGEGRSADDRFNSIYRYGGQHQGGLGLMANFETTPPVRSDCWQHSATQLPVAQWACVEWHFGVARNEMEFWLDGTELGDLHVVDTAKAPGSGCLATADLGGQWLAPPAFQSLYFGWERYQEPENDQNVWFDDIAVSASRIGCPE